MRIVLSAIALVAAGAAGVGTVTVAQTRASSTTPLERALAVPTRSPANVARDTYRHPSETLTFFGVKPTDTVVEIWPGGGWYTEILAPYLSAKGKLTVAAPTGRGSENIAKKLDANAAVYGRVMRANFPAAGGNAVKPGSADVVLTFRNIHNWRFEGANSAQDAFNEMFAMLKPGGTLGVVEHRLPEEMDTAMEEKSGYMKRSSVVAFAQKAGFKLSGESDINANPRDTHDYPKGVWTLPPNYAEKDVDRARYAAIGESDRMTLRFVKPRR